MTLEPFGALLQAQHPVGKLYQVQQHLIRNKEKKSMILGIEWKGELNEIRDLESIR